MKNKSKVEGLNGQEVGKLTQSYLQKVGKEPLCSLTLGQLVGEAAGRWGDKECFLDVAAGQRLTFKEIDQQSDWVARGLLTLGLNPGDRIGIWGPNSLEWVITFVAAAKAGLISTCINRSYQARELVYSLKKTETKAIVFSGPDKMQNYYEILTRDVPDLELSTMEINGDSNKEENLAKFCPTLRDLILISMEMEPKHDVLTIHQIMEQGRLVSPQILTEVSQEIQFDDILTIQFTSGTTGKSKGVSISHQMLINSSAVFNDRFRMTSKDRCCVTIPMFHAYGMFAGIMTPFHCGSLVIYPSPKFSPSTAIQVVARERCTVIYGTPTMHSDMLNVQGFNDYDLTSLRLASASGSLCCESLILKMKKNYNISNVIITMGTTETLAIASSTFTEESENNNDLSNLTPTVDSSCHLFDHCEVKVADRSGKIVPIGVMGELLFRSYSVMPGYWNDPEKTQAVIDSSRWFHTEDACIMLETGHLSIVGRFKDVIDRGGEKIWPKEVEEFLHSHPDILEAHVFGVADARLGEVVAAWVLVKRSEEEGQVTTVTEAQIQEFCKGQISIFKIPKYIKVISKASDFPKSSLGKIPKGAVRAAYEKELGLLQPHNMG